LRLFAKQIVRRPRVVRAASSRDASPRGLARRPSSGSSSSGFHSPVDHGRRHAAEGRRELAWIRDRRRGEEQLRLGPVHAGQPPQPAQHVADV